MYCTACGAAIASGQVSCPQCGRPAVAIVPPAPPLPHPSFDLQRYATHLNGLAIAWFVYAGLTLVLGFAGISFARMFVLGRIGHRLHANMPPPEFFSIAMHMAWVLVVFWTVMLALTGWSLLERASWGRILAIVMAILCLFKFPLGTGLGIWTLIMLLGARNTTMYEQL